MSYCVKCGNKVSENAKFCGSCGHKISNTTEKSDKIKSKNSISISEKEPSDKTFRNRNQQFLSKIFVFTLGIVLIVAVIFLIKKFDKKSKQTSDSEEQNESYHDFPANSEEAYAEDENTVEDDLSFILSEDEDEFRDGLFNFGLQTKSDLIQEILQHLRNDGIIGKLTGKDYESVGATDGIGYESEIESEIDFFLEVFQFKNEIELQKSLNEGALSDFKDRGEIYVNDCVVLFISNELRDFGYNTDEISNRIIKSFKSFKN